MENDRRLFGCLGSGSVFGVTLAAYALTIHMVQDPGPPPPRVIKPPRNLPFIVKRPDDEDLHRKLSDLRKHHLRPGEEKHLAAAPHAAHPTKKHGVLSVGVLTSRSDKSGVDAYALLGNTLKSLDMDKLQQVATLSRTNPTRLDGRIGKKSDAFNLNYYVDGKEGRLGDGLVDGGPSRITPRAARDVPASPGQTSFAEVQAKETVRSTASILAVIKSHSPGLRHLYNQYLRLRPGLGGKITLRFAIAPGGEVVDVGLAGSTTSAPDFDAQVVEKVMTWRFEPVKAAGNDLVTVPFDFSE